MDRAYDRNRMQEARAVVTARYREGGALELTSPCGRVSPVDWRGDRT